jgi:hypothetical protein
MRKNHVSIGLLACVLALGCQFLKKGDADAGDDGSAAATDGATAVAEAEAPPPPETDAAPAPAPVVVTAKNAADVARFPAEAAVADDDSKLAAVAYARSSPKSGTVVATLQPGADVAKIAEYQNSILVQFADPKDASTTLLGWIGKESFTAPAIKRVDGGVVDAGAPKDAGGVAVVDAGAKKLTCAANQVAVVLSKDPVCKKKCAKDADCKGGAAGSCAPASTATGGVAKVCTTE